MFVVFHSLFQRSDATNINFEKIIKWLTGAKKGLRGVGYVGNGEPLAFKKFRELSNFVKKKI